MPPWRRKRNSQRIATRPTHDTHSPHVQPHVHSPCAQPLDDGRLHHVKMLQLLARCELARKRKAAHRVHRGGWRRARWRRRAGRRRRGEPVVPAARLFLSRALQPLRPSGLHYRAADRRPPRENACVRIPKFSRAGCSPGARSVHTASTPYKYFLPIGDFIRDAGQRVRRREHFSVKTKDTATKRCLCL